MAKRYIGDATIEIFYRDSHAADRDLGQRDGAYHGKIYTLGGRVVWPFDYLYPPKVGFDFAYDGPEAYDEMAAAAVSFGSNYDPEGSFPREVYRAIDDATSYAMDDRGRYDVRRRRP